MSKKQKIMRWIISGTLLAAVALVGVSVYQIDMSQQEKMEELNEIAQAQEDAMEENDVLQGGNSTASLDEMQPHHAVIEDEEEELPQTENVTSNEVTAQMENAGLENEMEADAKDLAVQKNESDIASKNDPEQETKEDKEVDNTEQDETEETSAGANAIVPNVNFSGELLMNWPVEGAVLMDYSMDRSVFFETLNVYKYNPSVLLEAEVGTPVEAAANMKILSVEDTLETGLTITADMGNGYTAVYGQLKDVTVETEDVVAAGTVLGYVQEPTKYYTKEGANLYFAMQKDGESIDPVLYLP